VSDSDEFLRAFAEQFGIPGEFLRSTTRKRRGGRPAGSINEQTRLIREAICALQNEHLVVTVRQAFYALTVRGVVEKTEAGYRQVQRQILVMRRDGLLPWQFIADSTRWQRKPATYNDVEDALAEVARTYRRNLWRAQDIRLEIWLEKDALASVVMEATGPWDVPLMVSRGQASDTFCYSAGQAALEAWNQTGIETLVFALYDSDRSGRVAAEKIEEKLNTYSSGAPISFKLLAVTDEQIDEWNLPTRPAKENAEEIAVELDAIPPQTLITLVDTAIRVQVDAEAWEKEAQVEQSEREILERMVEGTA
jgi:hypothetical protein